MTVAVIITYFQRLLLKLLTTGIVIKRFSCTNSLMDLENNFKNIQNVTKVFKRHFRCSGCSRNNKVLHLHHELHHHVKSVRIRNFSGPYFPAFGLNTKRYSVFSVSSPNAGKYGPTKLRTLFPQCMLERIFKKPLSNALIYKIKIIEVYSR